MLSRPAALKDPVTPDQIVLDQHSLTHFPSQLWCNMCGGRESPLRERSTIDAVVPQLQFDYGNMGDGLDRLYFSSFEQTLLLYFMRHWCQTPRIWACLAWLLEEPSGCVIWSVNDSVYTETRNEFFSCYWTKLPKNVVLKDKAGKFHDKCRQHRVSRPMAQRRRPSPQCAVLLSHAWKHSKTKSRLST